MTEKPNCSTCDKPDCLFKRTRYGIACVDHPGAREYLMAPVIKELEEQPYNIMITRDEVISLIRDGVK